MKNYPTISCCIAAYNEEKYLPRQLEAIRNQTHIPDETILIDDGSTDNTSKIIKDFTIKYDGLFTSYKNKNPSTPPVAFNQAVSFATSDWLYLASANDILEKNAFYVWKKVLEIYPNIVLITGNNGWSPNLIRHFKPLQARRAISRIQGITGESVFIRRDVWNKFGGWNPDLKWYCDIFLYHVVAAKYGCVTQPCKITEITRDNGSYYSKGEFDLEEIKKISISIREVLSRSEYNDVRDFFYGLYAWRKFFE